MRLATVAAAVTAAVIPFASAECAKGCSGHGECNTYDACDCYAGFIGSDCSQRVCPSALAFVDTPRGDLNHDGVVQSSSASVATAYSKVQWSNYKAYEVWPTIAGAYAYKDNTNTDLAPAKINGGGWAAQADEAHFYAECSGKGSCDRTVGVCKCFDGYEGGACQRTKCPNDCSGHGTCTKVADLASGGVYRFSDSVNKVNSYEGVLSPFYYNLWDGEKNTKCVCDAGYGGPDCSMRTCPRGDDPLTVANPVCGNDKCTSEIQGFTINGKAANDNKSYRIKFFDYDGVAYFTNAFMIRVKDSVAAVTDKENLDRLAANEEAVKDALESLPLGVTGNVTVDCDFDKTDVLNIRCTVAFTSPMGNGLSGNIPEFVVEAITGAPPVAQPSQPVHVFTFAAAPAGNAVVSFELFPLDLNGFRIGEFKTTSATISVGGNPSATTVGTAVSDALQSRADGLSVVSGVSAFVYKHGVTGATVAIDTAMKVVTVVMPSKLFGALPMKLTIGSNTEISKVDTKDGNKEASICANRGLCDYTSGLCQCFTGYTGKACESQSTLAM